jgi:hypothetical protein
MLVIASSNFASNTLGQMPAVDGSEGPWNACDAYNPGIMCDFANITMIWSAPFLSPLLQRLR